MNGRLSRASRKRANDLRRTCSDLAVLQRTETDAVSICPVEVAPQEFDRFLADAAEHDAALLEPVADGENLICGVIDAGVPCLRSASHAIHVPAGRGAWGQVPTCWPHLLGAAHRVLYGPGAPGPRLVWNQDRSRIPRAPRNA